MDNKIAIALKKAAEYIRSGESKQAQRLLVAILKEEPKLEQAWYMLSFVVENERVVFVLNQVLAINPENENAKNRLEKWQKDQQVIVEAEIQDENEEEWEGIPEDTVSDRLDNYGRDQEEAEISKPREEVEEIAPENFMDGDEFTDRKERSKLWLILLLLIVIVGGFWAVYQFTDVFKPAEPDSEALATTTEIAFVDLESTATETKSIPTETLTPTNTPTRMPTSMPTIPPTATSVVFPTPVVELAELLAELDGEIIGFRDFDSPAQPEKLILSQYDALNYFNLYFLDSNKSKELEDTQAILAALNVIHPDYNLEISYFNRQGLLNSTYNASEEEIAVYGIPFNTEQKFSYVYSFLKAQLTELIIDATGITPGECEWLDQECQVLTALVWGDAFYSSELWAASYLDDEARAAVSRIDRRDNLLLDLNTPDFILADSQFAFEKGKFFAFDLYNISLWWTELDAVYTNPPTTTEQLMHVNKYIAEEEAVEINDPDLTEVLSFEWEELWNGSFGEWYTYLFLRHSYDVAYDLSAVDLDDLFTGAAEGWGGDQIQIYQNPAGRIVIAAHWALDTAFDTDEFLDAFTIYQNARFKDTPPQMDTIGGTCWQQDIVVSCVFTDGQEVLWIYTPGEEMMMDVLEIFQRFE